MTTMAELKNPELRQKFVQSIAADQRDDGAHVRQTVHLGSNKGFDASPAGLDQWIAGSVSYNENERIVRMKLVMSQPK